MQPTRTQYGKWVIYRAEDGERMERWPVDARPMLDSGEFVAVPPEGEVEPPADGPAPAPAPKVMGIEAERASRLREKWDKATPPEEYLNRYGPDTPAGQLAQQIVEAEAEARKHAGDVKIGEAGPAEPVRLPGQG